MSSQLPSISPPSGVIYTRRWRSSLLAVLSLIAGSLFAVSFGAPAAVAGTTSTGTGISYTLEGCKASVNAYLTPGQYICPDANYTTGNLGKGWNELDLVPGRVILGSGTSAPETPQTYSFAIAADYCSGVLTGGMCSAPQYPGYDRIAADGLGEPTLNTALSSSAANCGSISWGSQTTTSSGGSLYRIVTITNQYKNTTCVYDFYSRLAFNSHLNPGSSLHFNLLNTALGTAGIGSKDISIPVSAILPPGLSKTQASTQGSSNVWTVGKSVDEGTVNFPNTCPATTSYTQQVNVTVTWTKTPTVAGDITVTADITVTNNAHRPLNVSVTDTLYNGSTQGTTTPVTGAASTSKNPSGNLFALSPGSRDVMETWDVPAGNATSFNDLAVATFTDPVFLDSNQVSAAASSTVQTLPAGTGDTAVVTDVELLTDGTDPAGATPATDMAFSVNKINSLTTGYPGTLYSSYDPSNPSNDVTYSLVTATQGPVTWVSGTLSGSGSVIFAKTISVLRPTQEAATLHDTATVAPSGQTATTASAQTDVTSGAAVSVTVSKKTTAALTSDKTFTFNATGTDNSTGSTSVIVYAGHTGPYTSTITGLNPGIAYTIEEPAVAPFPGFTVANADALSAEVDLPDCTTTLSVVNTAAPAAAQVRKITVPAPSSTVWTFTLSGQSGAGAVNDLAGGSSEILSNVSANAGYVPFTSLLDVDGATYTITETPQTHWDLTTVSGDVAADTSRVSTSLTSRTCSFTLNLTSDSGHLFECSFTNTQESDVTVVKTQNGAAPTFGYSFELKSNSPTPASDQTMTTSVTNGGTLDFGYLVPGSYKLCELSVPAGTTSTLQTTYGGSLDPTSGNVCLAFDLAAGADRTFAVDNRYPLGGQRTIGYWKHWNSYTLGSNASAIAAKTGNTLMDSLLPQWLGNYEVSSAQQGVSVLASPSSKYAENQLAAQLLAAELNVLVGGGSACSQVSSAIIQANLLLQTVGYMGPPSQLIGANSPYRSNATMLATLLNSYNNATLGGC